MKTVIGQSACTSEKTAIRASWTRRAGRALYFLALPAVALTASAGAWAEVANYSLSTKTIYIQPGARSGSVTVLLHATNVNPEAMDKPLSTPVDLGKPDGDTKVGFEAAEMPRGKSSRTWLLTVDATRLPLNASQQRYIQVELAGETRTLDYTLSNLPTAAFEWTVVPLPAEFSQEAGKPIAIGVTVGPVPATNVSLSGTTLVEARTKHRLAGERLTLCRAPSGCDGTPLTLEPNRSHRLWLLPTGDDALIGKFSGTITLTAAEKPIGGTASATIFATTSARRWLGVAVILLGVAVGWGLTGPLRSWMRRLQLLRPAAVLVDKLAALRPRLDGSPGETAELRKALNGIEAELSEAVLEQEGHLPAHIPWPWSSDGPNPTAYRDYLQARSQQVACLDMLIEAVSDLRRLWAAAAPPDQPRYEAAINEIDELASARRTDAAALAQAIAAIMARAQPAAKGLRAPSAPAPTRYEQLTVATRRLSLAVWAGYAALTVALGAYVLVWTNNGFGVGLDYLDCLFWGAGLPAATQLAQATPATVATALGVSNAK
ncbi:hypothetical protein [Desertibaculum subflavum]|uniref:hypothetical protein n=1 Tax=Desertibaculum subflavum TaxID=2268458 RepID=UPI0013C52A05